MSSDTSLVSSSQNTHNKSIRYASNIDLPALASILGSSFYCDPLSQWIFPNPERRKREITRYFARLMKPLIKNGVVTTIECKCVAVWVPPKPHKQTLWGRYRESLYMRYTHGHRVHQVRNCLRRMADRHPRTPHWYLLALATKGDCRGQGMARRLLEDMLEHCDREGQQAALETSKVSNLQFYEKFGFDVMDELLVSEGVKTWLMCR